ncbi:PEP-CTERM sorting domain-containing protein [bacterium]|nr:PEP-CTERM sorting domain-containing protein [bacterium]
MNTQVGVTVAAVPEPSGLALVAGAVAIGGLGTVARRRRAA